MPTGGGSVERRSSGTDFEVIFRSARATIAAAEEPSRAVAEDIAGIELGTNHIFIGYNNLNSTTQPSDELAADRNHMSTRERNPIRTEVTINIEQDSNRVNYSFRSRNSNEGVGYIIPRDSTSSFWEYREQLRGRPFYIQDRGNSCYNCRCPGIREELGFGNRDLARTRDFAVQDMEIVYFSPNTLPELYEQYKQQQGGEYRAKVEGFSWETIPDMEDKIVKEKKERRIVFKGMWDDAGDIESRENFVFLEHSTYIAANGRVIVDFFLVDKHGCKKSEGNLFTLVGNTPRTSDGYLELLGGISNQLGFDIINGHIRHEYI